MSNIDQPDPAAEKEAREKEAAEQAALPYTWKQTIGDVDISVPVPIGTRGKDLIVILSPTKIKVGLKGKDPILEVCPLATLSRLGILLTCARVIFQSQSTRTNQLGL
jgi:hypothetical protein